MANELRHKDVGGELSRAEWEAIGTHILNNQAIGDMIYAPSATQLSRLPMGIANQVLHIAGGIPTWASTLAGLTLTAPNINGVIGTTGLTLPAVTFAADNTWNVAQTGVTLTSPTINGTIATTGLTMPAFTLNGTIAGGGQEITNMGNITFADSKVIRTGVAANDWFAIQGYEAGVGYAYLMSFNGGIADPYINVYRSLRFADGASITTGLADNDWFSFEAVDNDTNTLSTVAVVQGATDPYIGLGGGSEFKAYASGKLELSGALTLNGQAFDAGAGYADITTTGVVALNMAKSIQLTEMAAPGAGAANTARIYAVVGGDTLTDLAAVFQDGTVDIFAQEATDPNSPIFVYPDNTRLGLVMRRPDKITTQFVAVFPSGEEFIMREMQHPKEGT